MEADHDLIDHLTATITTKDEQIAALTKKVEDFESRRDALLAARGRPGSARSVSKSISNGNNTAGVQHVSRPGSRQASSNFTTSVVAMPSESAYALPHQAVIVEEEAAPEPTPLGGGGQYTQQEMDEALAIMDAEWSEKAEMMEKEKEMEIVRLRKDLLRMKKDYAERIQGMKERCHVSLFEIVCSLMLNKTLVSMRWPLPRRQNVSWRDRKMSSSMRRFTLGKRRNQSNTAVQESL